MKIPYMKMLLRDPCKKCLVYGQCNIRLKSMLMEFYNLTDDMYSTGCEMKDNYFKNSKRIRIYLYVLMTIIIVFGYILFIHIN